MKNILLERTEVKKINEDSKDDAERQLESAY